MFHREMYNILELIAVKLKQPFNKIVSLRFYIDRVYDIMIQV